jgi:hypothetical protein
MSQSQYVSISPGDAPTDGRWDVPPQNQGQIVEVAYHAKPKQGYESCDGEPYKRVVDRSDGSVAYYRLADYRVRR